MQFGYKLATEALPVNDVVDFAVAAEEAGFDFVNLSDHFHPWLDVTPHAGFVWSQLGAIAARTTRVGLVTGVTCPSFRYHPAIIAQAAATVGLLSGGRFTLGVGAGERLNEHVVGGDRFPGIRKRHEAFREALHIIKLLWQGGYQSFDGTHLQLEDARVFDLPDPLPVIAVASSGPAAAGVAAARGHGLFATEPKPEIPSAYAAAGGTGPRYCKVPLAWAPTADAAAESILEKTRFALLPWTVLSELPNPVNFDAATQTVTADDVKDTFACGPDVERHVQVVQQLVDAGFDHITLQNASPDPEAGLRFYRDQLLPRLRALAPATSVA